MLVRRACRMYFSVLVEYIVIYSLVSKGRVSLFGSVFFRLPFPSSHFSPLRQPDFTLQFVAAPVQFFSQLLTNVSVALVHLSVAFQFTL